MTPESREKIERFIDAAGVRSDERGLAAGMLSELLADLDDAETRAEEWELTAGALRDVQCALEGALLAVRPAIVAEIRGLEARAIVAQDPSDCWRKGSDVVAVALPIIAGIIERRGQE
jgi:hypothetical protein